MFVVRWETASNLGDDEVQILAQDDAIDPVVLPAFPGCRYVHCNLCCRCAYLS